MNKPLPDGDITPLAESAIATFVLFSEYVKAGFTRVEAMQFVLSMLAMNQPKLCSRCQSPLE